MRRAAGGNVTRASFRIRSKAAVCLVAASFALACTFPVKRHDWSGYDGPGAQYFQQDEIAPPSFPDPIEPVNRSIFTFNDALITWVASPIGSIYRFVIPRFVRDRIRDFSGNLIWPRNLVANLLQGRFREAGTETARFGINTTVGLLGFWDPATRWWSIAARPEDFGQVFGAWGWHPSTFLVLPILGPSSIRDGLGLLPDSLLDPAFYFFPASYVLTWNDVVDMFPGYRLFTKSSFDAYDDARLVWTLHRNAQVTNYRPELPKKGDDTGAVQTLQAAFLAPNDPGFWTKLDTGQVEIPETGRRLPYSYRLQPGKAPVVYLVPGLGTHRLGSASLALGEMIWKRGFSVVIVSNALNFEFMQRAASVPVPGHAPVDSRDLHRALDAVARQLEAGHPDRFGARVFMGYSLGAFHGFFLAAHESEQGNEWLEFDRYVLLDPPVKLVYGMQRLDAFYNAPLAFPPDQREAEVNRILRKAFFVATETSEHPGWRSNYSQLDPASQGLGTANALPFTTLEAEYLIGLAFRRTLQTVLWVSQTREDLGILQTRRTNFRRWAAYAEMSDYSWTEYMYGFVVPFYQNQLGLVASADELIEQNDLHAIAGPLKQNPKLRIFANHNDFLTRDDDIEWLTQWVGPERVAFFPTGGHLGNLNKPEVQDHIMGTVADLAPPSDAAR